VVRREGFEVCGDVGTFAIENDEIGVAPTWMELPLRKISKPMMALKLGEICIVNELLVALRDTDQLLYTQA
jgi:hypothetical protein